MVLPGIAETRPAAPPPEMLQPWVNCLEEAATPFGHCHANRNGASALNPSFEGAYAGKCRSHPSRMARLQEHGKFLRARVTICATSAQAAPMIILNVLRGGVRLAPPLHGRLALRTNHVVASIWNRDRGHHQTSPFWRGSSMQAMLTGRHNASIVSIVSSKLASTRMSASSSALLGGCSRLAISPSRYSTSAMPARHCLMPEPCRD